MTSRTLFALALAGLLTGCESFPGAQPSGGGGSGGAATSGSGSETSGSGVQWTSSSSGYPDPCSDAECSGIARLSTGVVRCAVRKNGEAVCWGGTFPGTYDSVGDANPYPIPDLHDAVAASVGDTQMCFLRASGRVACLGYNADGEVGSVPFGTSTETPIDVPGVEDAVEIAAGTLFTCARLASGKVLCWGDGRLVGAGLVQGISGPVAVLGLDDALSLSAMAGHACAAKKNGKVVCWGKNYGGQLGDGTTLDSTVRVTVHGVSGAVAVSAGWNGGCARLVTNRVLCWGDQISVDPKTASLPGVGGIDDALAVSGGAGLGCILRPGGVVDCWRDQNGEVTQPSFEAPAFDVAVGTNGAFAALTNGTVWSGGSTPTLVKGL
jgi:hypothetical protein